MATQAGDIVVNPSAPQWGLGIVSEVSAANAVVQFERRSGLARMRLDRLNVLTPDQVESQMRDRNDNEHLQATGPRCQRDHGRYPGQIIVCYECHTVLRARPLGEAYEVFVDASMDEIYRYCRRYHPMHTAFVQIGYFWNVFEQHADLCHELFGWEIGPFGNLRMSGTVVDSRSFEQVLAEMNQPHLFVAQLGPGRDGERMLRCITLIRP